MTGIKKNKNLYSRQIEGGKTKMETNLLRIKQTIIDLSKFNSSELPGISRFSYSRDDLKVRKYLMDICNELGLKVRIDAVGNVFARYEGSKPELEPVVSGSHIDSVKSGGMFDGIVGSVGALECARVMKENGYVPKRSFEVIFYAEEEGSNFQVPVMGSKILTGKLGIDDLKKMKTLDNKTAYDTIKKAGFNPDNIPNDIIKKGKIKASLELHIEQSVRLDLEKHIIGIIEGIAGCQWYKVTFKGKQNHAGATPMHLRQDPMCAASECISKVKEMAKQTSSTAVATVGFIKTMPNIPNAIPAEVTFTVDIRDIKNESMDEIAKKLITEAEIAAAANECTVEYECNATSKAIEIKDYMKETMKEEADKLGLDYIFMPSGAVHDSNYMAEITDVGMIFVPSIDGRSHVPEEKTEFEHIKLGTDLLLSTVLRLTAE